MGEVKKYKDRHQGLMERFSANISKRYSATLAEADQKKLCSIIGNLLKFDPCKRSTAAEAMEELVQVRVTRVDDGAAVREAIKYTEFQKDTHPLAWLEDHEIISNQKN